MSEHNNQFIRLPLLIMAGLWSQHVLGNAYTSCLLITPIPPIFDLYFEFPNWKFVIEQIQLLTM